VDGDEVVQVYVVPTASSLAPAPPFVPTRYLVGCRRVTVPAGGQVEVDIAMDAQETMALTQDWGGNRGLVAGQYTLGVGRGFGDELQVGVTVSV
jgi:hypothetical protein